MYLQSIRIYTIIELKVYNKYVKLPYLFPLKSTPITRKKMTNTMSNFDNYSYKSIILLIMVNLPPVNPDEK